MARPPLTLAALATAAVPGLEVNAARAHTRRSHGAFDAVEFRTTDDRHLIIRVPRSQAAESEQSADLVALRALTPGIRSRLPFAVPSFVGQAPVDGTRAVVTDFIEGGVSTADELTSHDRLAESVGLAIAAIHSLPAAFVGDAGLTRQSAESARESVVVLVDRAADTGHLPAALLRRWEEATDDDTLWRFRPTVVHGGLSADVILNDGETVTGVLGWAGLAEGDPARDLHWLLTSRGAAAERALGAYIAAREGGADAHLPQRALLYGELELARWLLHGVDERDQAIVDDAIGLLDGLVESVHDRSSEPLSPETGPILAVGDVERMLDETPLDRLPADRGGAMLTDSYDFSELHGARDAPMDATAPIPLDLSDWGDAEPPRSSTGAESGGPPTGGAGDGSGSGDGRQSVDDASSVEAEDQARRNAASS